MYLKEKLPKIVTGLASECGQFKVVPPAIHPVNDDYKAQRLD